MRSVKSQAVKRGWLGADERLLVPRLAYPLAADLPEVVHEFNRAARDKVVSEMLDGSAVPQANPSIFGSEEEIVVAEVERYGIPLRTVLGAHSGLMRSDPYYTDDYLARFYENDYRDLYRPRRFSHSWFFSEQVRSGQRILERVAGKIPEGGRILDLGCGMGGMLVPFLFAGHDVHGCDHGWEFARRGQSLALDIRIGGEETFEGEEPFDLIILSHVLEHTSDPVRFLSQVAGLLKPRGVCYIEVPGLLNLEQWYEGNLLLYLQNAHRWHFTAATLTAVLHRAGFEAAECDQTITCMATTANADPLARPEDGETVLDEIRRLEKMMANRTASTVRAA